MQQSSSKDYQGGQNVGGGDPIKTLFFKAKLAASQMVLDVGQNPENSSQNDWVKEHYLQLAEDIVATQHQWTNDLSKDASAITEFCAATRFERNAIIQFNIDECDKRVHTIFTAIEVIVHESVHHLGIKDENFVEQIVTAITGSDDIDPDFSFDNRGNNSALFIGSRVLYWGGGDAFHTGAFFDPYRSAWFPLRNSGAPLGSLFHSALWTGEKMAVFGGLLSCPSTNGSFLCNISNKGGLYDPIRNRWIAMKDDGAPEQRFAHSAVWNGKSMLVWGGRAATKIFTPATKKIDENNTKPLNDGAIFDVTNNSWIVGIATEAAPAPRSHHIGEWLGKEMIIWGGIGDQQPMNGGYNATSSGYVLKGDEFLSDGGAYNPAQKSWRVLPKVSVAPARRILGWPMPHAHAVAGQSLFIAGRGQILLQYDAAADRWQKITIPTYDVTQESYQTIDDIHVQTVNHDPHDPRNTPEWELCWTGERLVLIASVMHFMGWSYDPVNGTWEKIYPFSRINYDINVAPNSSISCDARKLLVKWPYGNDFIVGYDLAKKTWQKFSLTNSR